jgi:hypothetical protein
MNKIFASVAALRSKYYWKAVIVRNAVYWKSVAIKNTINERFVTAKNSIYWSLYNSNHVTRLTAIAGNFPIYAAVFIGYLAGKLTGRKNVVVFLLMKSHYEWVKEILSYSKTGRRLVIQIFSPDDLSGLDIKDRCFSTKGIVPTKGIQLIPSLLTDLYITPASTTAHNAPYSGPRVMFLHSLVSIHGVYENNTFDGYDYIYCTGKHHVEEFRDLFFEKGLSGKCLIPGGYPKLDELLERASNLEMPSGKLHVIIAPTLLSEATENVSLMSQARQLIDWFVNNEWTVIFRPHPINLAAGNKYLPIFEELIDIFHDCANFEVDRSKDYFDSYSRSSLMVSDVSGTAYTYALGFGRPVMFVEKSSDSVFARGLLYKNRHRLGRTISSDSELPVAISFLMANYGDFTQDIKNLRSECIFNMGSSAKYFADNIEFVLGGKKHPEWTYV